jgi:hypothetical protein
LKEKPLNGIANNFEVASQNIRTYKRIESCCSKQKHDRLSDAQEIGLQSGTKNYSYSYLKLCVLSTSTITCPHEMCTIRKETTNTSVKVAGNFFSWTLHKYTLKQSNIASNGYIIILIARTKLYLQYYIIRFTVNNKDMLIRKFDIDAA